MIVFQALSSTAPKSKQNSLYHKTPANPKLYQCLTERHMLPKDNSMLHKKAQPSIQPTNAESLQSISYTTQKPDILPETHNFKVPSPPQHTSPQLLSHLHLPSPPTTHCEEPPQHLPPPSTLPLPPQSSLTVSKFGSFPLNLTCTPSVSTTGAGSKCGGSGVSRHSSLCPERGVSAIVGSVVRSVCGPHAADICSGGRGVSRHPDGCVSVRFWCLRGMPPSESESEGD